MAVMLAIDANATIDDTDYPYIRVQSDRFMLPTGQTAIDNQHTFCNVLGNFFGMKWDGFDENGLACWYVE